MFFSNSIFRFFSILAILFVASQALAITEYDRFVQLRKPAPAFTYRFGFSEAPAILPGTAKKKRCISMGTALCLNDRPTPPSYQRYQNRLQESEQIHPRTLPRDHY